MNDECRCLAAPDTVLNRNWQAVNVATVARALALVWNVAGRVVDVADCQTFSWRDWSRLGVADRKDGNEEIYIDTCRRTNGDEQRKQCDTDWLVRLRPVTRAAALKR